MGHVHNYVKPSFQAVYRSALAMDMARVFPSPNQKMADLTTKGVVPITSDEFALDQAHAVWATDPPQRVQDAHARVRDEIRERKIALGQLPEGVTKEPEWETRAVVWNPITGQLEGIVPCVA